MPSIRNEDEDENAGPDSACLDAARDSILAVGWRRTTLTDVARRAGVSRMTIYRRWPDMRALLADLMVREWGTVADASLAGGKRSIAEALTTAVTELRQDALFRRILDVDPELLLPYLLDRRGRNQDHVLELLVAAIAAGQADGTLRSGDPGLLARALLLALQGFLVSQQTMADVPPDRLDGEMTELVERYLRP